MAQNDDIRFISSSIKLPSFSPPPDPHFPSLLSSLKHTSLSHFPKFLPNFNFKFNFNPQLFLGHKFNSNRPLDTVFKRVPLFCSAALAIEDSQPVPVSSQLKSNDKSVLAIRSYGDNCGTVSQTTNAANRRAAEGEGERVLISEVLVRNKDGEELQRKDLEAEALNALKASRPNAALTAREVQEDVHRIVESGYFMSCMPVAVDTRDGIRLVFQVDPNEECRGLICEGANVLPSKFVEDVFCDGYGKVVNIKHLDDKIGSINDWYMEQGFFGMVSGVEILSGGIIKLQVSEAEVNNISLRFLDKTGEPTVGKTRPETILRQLTTKNGQVYNMIQGRRDVETVLAMGTMDDVGIVPQPVGDTDKVDLTLNVVEHKRMAGVSGGGGISRGITSGPLAGLIGSFAIYHKNLFGRNQKLNMSLERGHIDSIFRINYTDPWVEGDDKRTSRTIMVQNSRTPGTLVHNQPGNIGLTIAHVTAGIEYGRPFRPKWNGTAGLVFQRSGGHDERGNHITTDLFGSPLTASGKTNDYMLLAKLETVYSSAGDTGSSMFGLNLDQGLPVSPEWLVFSRVNARAIQGLAVGPARLHIYLSGGHVVGKFPPHEAFPIGGTNSVRGYEEGEVGSGRSYVIGSGEVSFPLKGPMQGTIFADYGTDLKSGPTIPGDPAGVRNKAGSGYGYGIGVRMNSPLGPLRLEYAFNDQGFSRFHFGIGLRT